MRDFTYRTIESEPVEFIQSGDKGGISMSFLRTRTSKGFRSITAKLGKKEITFSSDDFGDEYEQVAFTFAKGLQEMVSQSCSLPDPNWLPDPH